jgi:hypothetical protein
MHTHTQQLHFVPLFYANHDYNGDELPDHLKMSLNYHTKVMDGFRYVGLSSMPAQAFVLTHSCTRTHADMRRQTKDRAHMYCLRNR